MALETQTAAPTSVSATCSRCGKQLTEGRAFAFKPPGTGPRHKVTKCFSCALRHRPMLKRSAIAAVVVGTILTALNQGDMLISGQWSNSLYWKIPLTYCVPLLVATYGALTNSRQ